MLPKEFVFVPQMPRTPSGKVDERRLVQQLLPPLPAPAGVAPTPAAHSS
jgi:acyl-coenzyme A synthetase/AMP-(fatty) acid ligase